MDFKQLFGDKDGCFILYSLDSKKTVAEFNKKKCAERLSPCSTFKIPIALMAFDQGILKDTDTVIKWDGVDHHDVDWNRDQTPVSWLKFSTLWVSQWITPKVGMPKINKYLADFKYGNQDTSGGITQFWLWSTLKISAREQILFFERLWSGRLAVSSRAMELTKKSMDSEASASGTIITGKTGSGYFGDQSNPATPRVGWYVGHLQHGKEEYFFATNFTGQTAGHSGGPIARAITRQILKELGLF
ncbi:MAG: penicillin-binding transpeptidase domain-containing protein [Elusimicrobiales bacterium]|nr:penicillin-binding transpeptidase domain-containing protein [Elusimicrobiales bacterium]